MGQAKKAMMEHEDNVAMATDYLVSIGVLNRCEFHDIVHDGGEDLESMWAIVMAERNRGPNGRVPWAAGMAAREYTDLLKEAYEDHCGDGCYACDKNARD